MLYKVAHILRDKLSWLWNIIELMNGVAFSQRYAIHRPHGAAGAVQQGNELFYRRDGGEDARGGNIHAPRKRTGRGAVL